jgi:farnesyl diphosphate synthase
VPPDPRAPLYEAMRYAAIGGGKRLRPLLVVAACGLFHVDRERALRVGLAVECIHVYSLIHDDLPCMDDDDLRRGKPTLHRAFDEATAILAGDSLHALAFEVLADEATHEDPFVRAELIAELARAAGPSGMAGGQMMDLAAEETTLDLAAVTRLQQLKTGALIGFCLEAGGDHGPRAAGGPRPLRGYARDVGLAFQIADDLLDVEGEEEKTGKRVGKDGRGQGDLRLAARRERARQQAEMLVEQAIEHLAQLRRGGRPAPRHRPLRRRARPLGGAHAHEHRRLSRHVRSDHARPHGHHPPRREAGRPAGDRSHHQSLQVADVHVEERMEMVRREIAGVGGDIEVVSFDSLLMDFAEREGASMIVRGLRAVADFEYEYQMAGMNQQLNDRIETVFLMADVSLQPIASRLVKEIALYGGDIRSSSRRRWPRMWPAGGAPRPQRLMIRFSLSGGKMAASGKSLKRLTNRGFGVGVHAFEIFVRRRRSRACSSAQAAGRRYLPTPSKVPGRRRRAARRSIREHAATSIFRPAAASSSSFAPTSRPTMSSGSRRWRARASTTASSSTA